MPSIWCKCHGCLALSPEGSSFSKAEYKIHQLRLQREEQNQLLASQLAIENELFGRSVADSISAPFDAPSAMWNSRGHIQARAFDMSPPPDSANATTTTSLLRTVSVASHLIANHRRLATLMTLPTISIVWTSRFLTQFLSPLPKLYSHTMPVT
jgi:hypothetical protein